MSLHDNSSDSQAGLTDMEFACLVFRSCGVPLAHILHNLGDKHQLTCGFCTGEKKVA
jgi:hypothetical protein